MTAAPVLSIRDLTVAFGTRKRPTPIVHGVDLDLFPGRVQGLAGESGSGKTVTAMCVLGLLPRTAQVGGSVRLGETELLGLARRELNRVRGRRIAMVFQDRSEEHTSELQSRGQLVCRLLPEKKNEAAGLPYQR